MTGLRQWRKIAKSLIIFSFACEAVVAIVSLMLLILIMIQGGAPSPDSLIYVVGTLGLYGVVIWAIWDAQRRRRRRPRERVATAEEEA
jgi:hypothetical protein